MTLPVVMASPPARDPSPSHRFQPELCDRRRHLFRRPLVRDVKLPGGAAVSGRPFAGILRQRHDPPALGAVEILSTCARITAGFGMASALIIVTPRGSTRCAGARVRASSTIPTSGRKMRKAQRLDQFTVGHFVRRLKFPRAGAQSRQRHGQLRLPAVPQKILGVGGKAQRLEAPICQAEQRCRPSRRKPAA